MPRRRVGAIRRLRRGLVLAAVSVIALRRGLVLAAVSVIALRRGLVLAAVSVIALRRGLILAAVSVIALRRGLVLAAVSVVALRRGLVLAAVSVIALRRGLRRFLVRGLGGGFRRGGWGLRRRLGRRCGGFGRFGRQRIAAAHAVGGFFAVFCAAARADLFCHRENSFQDKAVPLRCESIRQICGALSAV